MLSQKKAFQILTLASYGLLFVFAFFFYKERLNVDTSYYFFKTLNEKWFHIEHDRLVLGIAELPVWVGSLMQVSLKSIAIAYSLWHVAFFFLIGLLISLRYKKPEYLLLFLMLQLVGIIYGFVCPVFEQYYGTALLAAMYIILRHSKKLSAYSILTLFILSVFAISSHPFNLILYTMLLLLDFVYRRNKYLLIGFLSLVPLFLIFKIFHVSEYEKGKVSWIFDLVHNKTYLKLTELSHWKKHAHFLFQYYKEVLLALLLYTMLAFRQKLFRQLTLIILFFAGALILINFSYAITEYSGYNEQVCYLLVPLVLIPLFTDALTAVRSTFIHYSLVILTCLVLPYRFYLQFQLAKQHKVKTERVMQWIGEARQKKQCRNYVFFNQFSDISTITGWDIPYSSLLLSAFEKNQEQVTVVPLEDNVTTEVDSIGAGRYLFRYGEVEQVKKLNSQYFNLCDRGRYHNLFP